MPVLLHRLDAGLPVPAYAHPGDAGADLYARSDVTLEPGDRALVPTGVAMALPSGYAAFVHPRSGLAARHGVTTLNAPGTVDAGYRGEIHVNLLNTDRSEAFTVRRGDRIAQLVIQEVEPGPIPRGGVAPRQPTGGHWTRSQRGVRRPAADHEQPDRLKD